MTKPLVAGSDEEAHGSCYGQILLLKPRIPSEEALQAKMAAKEIAENRRDLFGILPVRVMSKSLHEDRLCFRERVFKRQPATASNSVSGPLRSERRKHVQLAADRYKKDVHREGIALHGRQIGQLHNHS
jgi:hypothetical protein